MPRPQFTLKTLLWFTTLLAMSLAVWLVLWPKEKTMLAVLVLGGTPAIVVLLCALRYVKRWDD